MGEGRPPLRSVIVGTGLIAHAHARALRDLDDEVELVGACDVDADRLAAFGERYEVDRCHDGIDALLEACRPDLVHLCTPPDSHRELAGRALEAGATVLSEKPPALSLQELDELAALEGDGGPWFATIFQHRFGSGAARFATLLEAGDLGRPLLALCHTTWFREQAYFDVPWRGRWETEGGGPTLGHGIHQMDLVVHLLGDWTEVSALARRQARVVDTEDLSLAHVTFASGAVASVVNSVLSPREETYLRFDLEHATVELTHLYGYEDNDWRITPARAHEAVAERWDQGPAGVRSGHDAQIRAVVAALRRGEPPPVAVADARRTMALVAGVYASAFTGRPVRPDELGDDSPFHARMQGPGPTW